MGKALERAALILPRGYLHGLTLSTAGSSATFSVALGEAVDDSFTSLMTTVALSKTTSAWAVGTGNGGLDTGSIAINTWYHVYLIKRPDAGVVDVLISLSASAPTMPTSYTLKRRIGAMKTNASSQWTAFTQLGDEFLLLVPVNIYNTSNPGTTAVTWTVSAPLGVQTIARLSISLFTDATQYNGVWVSSFDQTDTVPSSTAALSITTDGGISSDTLNAGGSELLVRTNSLSQVRARLVFSNANTVLRANSQGWIDTRGKLS